MMSLEEWQLEFSNYLVGDSTQKLETTGRYEVYKNSTQAIHINALKISYPVTHALLGERNFNQFSRLYLKRNKYPIQSLDDVGSDLDEFVDDCKQLDSISYLKEVVSLEWLLQALPKISRCKSDRSSQAAFNSKHAALQKTESIIYLASHVDIFYSGRSAVEIWKAHQQESITENIVVEGPSKWWLISNELDGIRFSQIQEKQFNLMNQIKSSGNLSELFSLNYMDQNIESISSLINVGLIKLHHNNSNHEVPHVN